MEKREWCLGQGSCTLGGVTPGKKTGEKANTCSGQGWQMPGWVTQRQAGEKPVRCSESCRHQDESLEEKQERRQRAAQAARCQRKISIQNILQAFMSAIKEGPDYVCTCCHCHMYQKTVQEFKLSKFMYKKSPEECLRMSVHTSVRDIIWICKTGDYALRLRIHVFRCLAVCVPENTTHNSRACAFQHF